MSDLIPRLRYYIKHDMEVGPLELQIYLDEIERLTNKLKASRRCHLEAEKANTRLSAKCSANRKTIAIIGSDLGVPAEPSDTFDGRVVERAASISVWGSGAVSDTLTPKSKSQERRLAQQTPVEKGHKRDG